MLAFVKKIIAMFKGESPSSSSLMEKAVHLEVVGTGSHSALYSLGERTYAHDVHDDLEESWIRQQTEDSHNPYINPGLDAGIDQYVHGIDRGLEDASHHHHDF